ncbi:MAG: Arc family DNA-binding protein [Planctomycetota bacterium]
MGVERKGFLVRLPVEVLEQLRSWAEQEMRSVNGQIEWVLREALRARKRSVEPKGDDEAESPPRNA